MAITVCILVLILSGILIVAVLATPVAGFQKDLPQIQSSLNEKIHQAQKYISENLNVSIEKQVSLFEQASSDMNSGGKSISGFLGGFIGFLTDIILVLVYIIFFLLNRERYEDFVVKLTKNKGEEEVRNTLHRVSQVSVQYLVGRLLSIVILSALYIIGLTAVGLKYAILLGSIAAFLTIVPYVGTFIGGLFPAAAAFFAGSGNPLLVLGVVFFVQLVDEYFIEPYIVGAKVNISPLAAIVAIVIGGILWGVSGMILFIPLFGMAKIIFDQVPSLHPYGELIGVKQKSENNLMQKIKNFFKKIVNK